VDHASDGWQSAGVPGRDPRYRPYRTSLWVIYFVALVLGVGTLIGSVARHLRADARRAPSGPPPTRAALRVCLSELEALYREQNQRAWGLAAEMEHQAPFQRWTEWSRGWETRVADLSDRCGLDAQAPGQQGLHERTEMAAARDAMMALHRAYAIEVTRFASDHGDLVQAAAEALAHARVAAANAR
jgi:hypothetical protein